jgi:hypothetical protein
MTRLVEAMLLLATNKAAKESAMVFMVDLADSPPSPEKVTTWRSGKVLMVLFVCFLHFRRQTRLVGLP